MITFVYCYICLLIVSCKIHRIKTEENEVPSTLPKLKTLHYKIGADVWMKCDNPHSKKENITWEFKHCDGKCDSNNMYELDYSEGQWKKLDFNRKRKKLEIKNVTKDSSGLYRCLYNYSIIKIYRLDLDDSTKHTVLAPEILSLLPSSNTTFEPNTTVVIYCKAKSEIPPEIRWFKECTSVNCEIHSRLPYNGHCYCWIPSSIYAFPISDNIYVSKLSIYNSRNIDSGTYVCFAMTQYGNSYKNVTVKVGDITNNFNDNSNSFPLLFLIPLLFILVPIIIWLGFYRRKKKNRRNQFHEYQKQLITPVVEL